MDSSIDSDVEDHSSGVSANEDTSVRAKVTFKRFSEAQKACLKAYFQQGMQGTGKKHASLIHCAARDTHLSTDQIKVRRK